MSEWTQDQKKAITAETGTLFVAAAAGSGKTSVLVERIVRKITDPEAPVPPEALLVVTFTNAAASEMRSRVFSRIGAGITSEPERRRELTALQSRLAEMKICTMDSFGINLVRENFHFCGVEPDFRILDEGEIKILQNDTVADVIERLYKEDGERFDALASLFSKDNSDRELAETIRQLSRFSMSEPDPEKWLSEIGGHFSDADPKDTVFGQTVSDEITEILDCALLLAECGLDDSSHDERLYDKFAPVFNSDIENIRALREAFDTLPWDERAARTADVIKALSAHSMRAPRDLTDDPYKLAAAAKRNYYKSQINGIPAKMCVSKEENDEDAAVLRPIAEELIKAVQLFNRELLERERALNAYSFTDILHFALGLLTDPAAEDGKTAAARELAEGFDEILIDEYQDTNRAQESLFYALSKNGENIFTVGDVKQSIYRFRLANPELFIEKCDLYPYFDGAEKRSKIILSRNFRSRKGVVDAVNFIFSALMSRKCGEIDYNDDEKLYYGANYPESADPDFEFDILEDPDVAGAEAEARFVAGVIRQKIDSGATVSDHGVLRPVTPGDFCILARSVSKNAAVFRRELNNAGLSVAFSSGDDFFDAVEIRMLVSLLRTVDNPSRDVDLLAVMLSPVFGFSPDEIVRIRLSAGRKSGTPLYSALCRAAEEGDVKCAAFRAKTEHYKKMSAVLPVGDLIETVLADTAFYSVCSAMKDGKLRKNNVRRFVEYAKKGISDGTQTLGGFIRYIDRLKENDSRLESAKISPDGGSVSMMTIHGSKGLEFPYVFITGTDSAFNRQDIRTSLIISHKNGIGIKRLDKKNLKKFETLSFAAIKTEIAAQLLSEEMRVYYVALTRAREKLYIVAAVKNADKWIAETGQRLPSSAAIPPMMIRQVSKPVTWFLMSLMRHPDASILRTSSDLILPADSPAVFRVIRQIEDVRSAAAAESGSEPDPVLTDSIRRRAEYVYPYSEVASALSKHAASKINEERFSAEYFAKRLPAFMSENDMSAADIGTATHRFMQYCDFETCADDPAKELERLVAELRLTPAEAKQVDTEAVRSFVRSDIMKRCARADAVYREKQFSVAKSVCEMDPSVPERFRNERTVVNGKIDMIFIENGKAVIVDYKTDSVKNASELIRRYTGQLTLYAEAVEKSLGVEVSECVLYSLKLKCFCQIAIK